MAIRFECEQCGSVLKIKDDLAGKPGKCPKCKTAFTVPELQDDDVDSAESDSAQLTSKVATSATDDFDVDDFLSNDPSLDSKAKSKSKPASKRSLSDFDEDELLSDEPPEKTKGKRQSSSPALDDSDETVDEVFQIRRNETKGAIPKHTLTPEDDDEEMASAAQSRRPPGTNTAGTASNMASDLLAMTGKKGKKSAWREAADEAKQESEYDYTELKNYLFKKVAPLILGGGVLCYLLYVTMFSALGSKSYLPELGQVTGTVTLNGKPVESVTVLFHPIQTSADKIDKKKRASSSGGTTDAAGHYELKYLGDVKGAAVGECHIGIEAPSRSDIPVKFLGPKFTVTKTVKAGRQVIDLDMSQ